MDPFFFSWKKLLSKAKGRPESVWEAQFGRGSTFSEDANFLATRGLLNQTPSFKPRLHAGNVGDMCQLMGWTIVVGWTSEDLTKVTSLLRSRIPSFCVTTYCLTFFWGIYSWFRNLKRFERWRPSWKLSLKLWIGSSWRIIAKRYLEVVAGKKQPKFFTWFRICRYIRWCRVIPRVAEEKKIPSTQELNGHKEHFGYMIPGFFNARIETCRYDIHLLLDFPKCSLEKNPKKTQPYGPPWIIPLRLLSLIEAEGFQDHRETGGVNSSCGVSRRDDVP